jgi:4-carboxymuconolactone decarboxylase
VTLAAFAYVAENRRRATRARRASLPKGGTSLTDAGHFDPHQKVSRLPPLPRPLDPLVQKMFDETRARGGDILNLHLTNGHAPRVGQSKRVLTHAMRNDCDCPRIYRELAICRAAFLVDCPYELKHHLPLVQRAGLSHAAAEAIANWRAAPDLFDEVQRAVLTYVDEIMLNKGVVSDQVFTELQKHFSPQYIVELTLNATVYYSNGLFMKALGVQPDEAHKVAAPGKF